MKIDIEEEIEEDVYLKKEPKIDITNKGIDKHDSNHKGEEVDDTSRDD